MYSRKGKEEPIKQEERKNWKRGIRERNDCKPSHVYIYLRKRIIFQNFGVDHETGGPILARSAHVSGFPIYCENLVYLQLPAV